MQVVDERVCTIHIGGSSTSPEVPGFDEETCRTIWDLFSSKQATRWGRKGLGIVTYVSGPGYDMNVIVQLENVSYPFTPMAEINCWMWNDTREFIEDWRRQRKVYGYNR